MCSVCGHPDVWFLVLGCDDGWAGFFGGACLCRVPPACLIFARILSFGGGRGGFDGLQEQPPTFSSDDGGGGRGRDLGLPPPCLTSPALSCLDTRLAVLEVRLPVECLNDTRTLLLLFRRVRARWARRSFLRDSLRGFRMTSWAALWAGLALAVEALEMGGASGLTFGGGGGDGVGLNFGRRCGLPF